MLTSGLEDTANSQTWKKARSVKNLAHTKKHHKSSIKKETLPKILNNSYSPEGLADIKYREQKGKSRQQLSKFMDSLEQLEKATSNFFYSKICSYKELRIKMDSFFVKEIRELDKICDQCKSNMGEVVKRIKAEEIVENNRPYVVFNSRYKNIEEDDISEDGDVGNWRPENDWAREQKMQQIEHEISLIFENIQKMKIYENQREKGIVDLIVNIINGANNNKATKPEKKEAQITKPSKLYDISVKFDLQKPFEIYFFKVPSLTGKKVKVTNVKLPQDSASILINSNFFVCGGQGESSKIQFSATFVLNHSEMRLEKRADMLGQKRNHCLASLKPDSFYSICGYSENSGYLADFEQYTIEENRWSEMPHLIQKRQDPTPCSVNGSKIYVIGGVINEGKIWSYLSEIEVFDVQDEDNGWLQVKIRKPTDWSARAYCGAVQLSGTQILIFGGFSGNHFDQCLELNMENSTIELLESKLPNPSSFVARNSMPIVANSVIYAMSSSGLEAFLCDLSEVKWKKISTENMTKKLT